MAKTNIKIIEVTPHHKQSRQRKESDVIRVAAYCRVSTLS